MQYIIFLVLAPLTTIILAVSIAMVSKRPRTKQSFPFLGALWVSLGFLVTNTLELAWPTEAGTMFFAKLGYPFSALIPVFLFLFTLAFTGHENWFSGNRWLLLLVVPAAATGLAATEPLHGLIWSSISYTPIGGMLAMNVTYGWFFWLLLAYTITLLVLCAFFLLKEHAHAPHVYRRQSVFVIVGVFIPLAMFILYALKAIPGLTKNYSPVAYGAAGLFLVASMRQHLFLDLIPIARSILMDEMTDAMLVVDLAGRIVDFNSTAKTTLGLAEDVIGTDVARFSELSRVIDAGPSGTACREIAIDLRETRRYYDAKVSRIRNRTNDPIGTMILLRDVSETHALIADKNRLIDELTCAAAEIKTLQGIIPICMYCKKVRDDEGFWHQVESYMSKHSNAQFSHGLCPDCLKRYEERFTAAPP